MMHTYFPGKLPQENIGIVTQVQRLEGRLKDIECCNIPQDYIEFLYAQEGECFRHYSNAFVLYGTEIQELANDQFGDSLLSANIKAAGRGQITDDQIVVGQMRSDALLIYSSDDRRYYLTSSATGEVTNSYTSIQDFIENGPHAIEASPEAELKVPDGLS